MGTAWEAPQREAQWDQPEVPGTITAVPLVALRARESHRTDSPSPGQALGPVVSSALLHHPLTYYHSSMLFPWDPWTPSGAPGHSLGH